MAKLTARKLRVLELFLNGQDNVQIAKELGIVKNTVYTYRKDALLVLNCTTLEQAAVKIGQNKQLSLKGAKRPHLKPYEEGLFKLVTQGVPEKKLYQKLGIDKSAVSKTIRGLIERANVTTYYELIVIANY